MKELDGSALESLVRDLAADPEVWEHLVQPLARPARTTRSCAATTTSRSG